MASVSSKVSVERVTEKRFILIIYNIFYQESFYSILLFKIIKNLFILTPPPPSVPLLISAFITGVVQAWVAQKL
jgi:hypothetical protein